MDMFITARGGARGSYGFSIDSDSKRFDSKDAADVVKYFDGVKESSREFALLSWTGPFAGDAEKADLQSITNSLRRRQVDFCVMQLEAYQQRSAKEAKSALCLMRDVRPRSDTPEYHYFLGFRYLGSGEVGCKVLLKEAPAQGVKQLFVACDARFDPKKIVRVCRERYGTIFPYGKVSPINPSDEWIFRKHDPWRGDDDYSIGSPYEMGSSK